MSDEKTCSMSCPLSGCPIKQVILATIVAIAVTFSFDFLYHGIYMEPLYQETAGLWRTEEMMQGLMVFCVIYHGVFGLGIGALYCFATKNTIPSLTHGIRFGLLVGLVFAASDLSVYMWLPFETMEVPVTWAVGRMIWGVLLGIALSFVCGKCQQRKDA